MPSFLLLDDLFELCLVLGPAPGSGRILNNARRLGLAHKFAGIGLNGLRGREFPWLAFRHGKVEYGVVRAGLEAPEIFICGALSRGESSDDAHC